MKFHDGSEMTSKDVKASYDKIIFPPPAWARARKGQYADVEAVEAPDPTTVVFRLKWPIGSFISSLLSSPWNFIYKADILAKDIHWYEKNIMGTGPFTFVEHVKGSHVVGKKNPDYWDKGKPYLDGFRAVFIRDSSAQVAAVRGERAHIQFRGFSPAERDSLVRPLGNKITVQESPWDCILLVAINHEKKPFDDKRVRRALTLALDRHEGSKALSQDRHRQGGGRRPGAGHAVRHAARGAGEARRLRTDIKKSRAEARRPAEGGRRARGLRFTFKNRGIPMPYEPLGIWLIDQWRQIGLNVKQEVIEAAAYYTAPLRGRLRGRHGLPVRLHRRARPRPVQVPLDRQEPGQLRRYKDPVLDELYDKQSRATDPRSASSSSGSSRSGCSTRRRTTS